MGSLTPDPRNAGAPFVESVIEADSGSFWPAFERELEQWLERGARATFWWRDDDATAASPALARLLEISAGEGAPLAIAAIPKLLAASLPAMLRAHRSVHVLQHGFAHCNHAARRDAGAWELGPHRRSDRILDELSAGREILRSAFGDQFIPVVVPPWNRIDRNLLPGLRQAGFIGLSASGERLAPSSSFVEAHVQFDLLTWKGTPRFRGEAAAQREIIGHLQRRRLGLIDSQEPTGILSHHMSLDEPAWRFLAELVRRIARHRAACWLSASEIFQLSGAA